MKIEFEIEDSKIERIIRTLVGSRPATPADAALLAKQYLELLNVHQLEVEAGDAEQLVINIDDLENLLVGLAGETRNIDDLNLRGVPVSQSFDGGATEEPFTLTKVEKHFQAIAAAALVDSRLAWVHTTRLMPDGSRKFWHWWIQPPYAARLPIIWNGDHWEIMYNPNTVILEGQMHDAREMSSREVAELEGGS